MKRITIFTGILACLLFKHTNTSAQYNSKINIVLQPGYQLPVGKLNQYYGGGFGAEGKLIASISKRKSICRVSGIVNIEYYRLSGKKYWAFDNNGSYNEYKTDGFSVASVHAGFRADLGNTKEIPIGAYISQDFGLTYAGGATGGARFGRTFDFGFVLYRIDIAMGFNTWKRSVPGNFTYFTVGIGYIF